MAVLGLQTTLSTNLNLRYSLGSNGGAIGRKVGGASVEVSQKTLKESSFRPADPCSQWERQSRNGCGMQESKNFVHQKKKEEDEARTSDGGLLEEDASPGGGDTGSNEGDGIRVDKVSADEEGA